MIFGMPASSFFTFAIWPIGYTVASIVIYFRMAEQDKLEELQEREGNE